jgi:hypothetical protein
MGEQTDGRPADRGQRFTDHGRRFGRRRFLGKAGIGALAVGTGVLLTGCQFDHGAYQGYSTGQSSTSGQNATSGQGGSHSQANNGQANNGQGSAGSQSGMSS